MSDARGPAKGETKSGPEDSVRGRVTRRLRVSVDRAVCIGSGMCVGSAPETFELDEGRQSHPKFETVDDAPAVWEAAECCPVEAISIHDAGTGEELFPGD